MKLSNQAKNDAWGLTMLFLLAGYQWAIYNRPPRVGTYLEENRSNNERDIRLLVHCNEVASTRTSSTKVTGLAVQQYQN